MSGHLVGQLAVRGCLSDVRFADSFLTIDNSVVIIAATDVVVGFWMLSGQVFPQGGLPGEFGLASGARDLRAGPRRRRRRRGGRRRRGRRGILGVGQSGLVPTSMRRQISRAREPLVALRTTVLHVGDPGATMLRQLEGVLVKLSAELALIRPEPILNLGQLGARFLRDLDDVEGGIDVAGHHCLVRT